jgi:hypothetical protein
MTTTPKEILNTLAMRWFGKSYTEVDKHEFTRRWLDDYRERHSDKTDQEFREWLWR